MDRNRAIYDLAQLIINCSTETRNHLIDGERHTARKRDMLLEIQYKISDHAYEIVNQLNLERFQL